MLASALPPPFMAPGYHTAANPSVGAVRLYGRRAPSRSWLYVRSRLNARCPRAGSSYRSAPPPPPPDDSSSSAALRFFFFGFSSSSEAVFSSLSAFSPLSAFSAFSAFSLFSGFSFSSPLSFSFSEVAAAASLSSSLSSGAAGAAVFDGFLAPPGTLPRSMAEPRRRQKFFAPPTPSFFPFPPPHAPSAATDPSTP